MKTPVRLLYLAFLTSILGCDSPAPPNYALRFSGTDRQEVHVGAVTSNTNRYCVEAWFRLDPGVDIESGIEPGIVGQHAGVDERERYARLQRREATVPHECISRGRLIHSSQSILR